VAKSRDSPPESQRPPPEERLPQQNEQEQRGCRYRKTDQQKLARKRCELGRKRTWQQQYARENQRRLRCDIEAAVNDISGEHCRGAGTAPQTYGEAHNIATNDGWKEQRTEQSAEVTLRARGPIQVRAGCVHHHSPFEDSRCLRAQIESEHDQESKRRHARERGAQRSDREKMKENSEDDEGGRPAKNRDEPRSRLVLRLVGADHVVGRRQICLCEKILAKILGVSRFMRLFVRFLTLRGWRLAH
jgi:hypothetical protein